MQSSEVHCHWNSDPSETLKKLWGQRVYREREQFMWKGKDATVIQRKSPKNEKTPNEQALGKSGKKKLPFRRKKPLAEPGQTKLIGSFYCGGVAALHEFLLKD